MATIKIHCPFCTKSIQVPKNILGKKIRCTGCKEIFVAEMAMAEVDVVEEVEIVDEVDEVEEVVSPQKRPSGKSTKPAQPAKPTQAARDPRPEKAKEPAKPSGKPSAKTPAKTPEKGKADINEDDEANPYGISATYLGARCPECANAMESEDAVVCLFCGFNTRTRERSKTRKIRDVTGGDVFLWLLPGIACVLGIILIIVYNIVYWIYISDWVNKEQDWYSFLDSQGWKMWQLIPSLFGIYKAGRFAIVRLFIDNQPPEIEE